MECESRTHSPWFLPRQGGDFSFFASAKEAKVLMVEMHSSGSLAVIAPVTGSPLLRIDSASGISWEVVPCSTRRNRPESEQTTHKLNNTQTEKVGKHWNLQLESQRDIDCNTEQVCRWSTCAPPTPRAATSGFFTEWRVAENVVHKWCGDDTLGIRARVRTDDFVVQAPACP